MHWLDPDHLPQTRGKLSSLIYNEHGDVDGMLFDNGQTVHMPPHLGNRVARSVRVGEEVGVNAVKPRAANVLVAVRVTRADGKAFDDEGPGARTPVKPPARKPVHVEGVVQTTLHAPKGEVSGAIMRSGEVIRMHPKGNESLTAYLQPGAHVEVWGDGFVRSGTRVIEIGEISMLEHADESA